MATIPRVNLSMRELDRLKCIQAVIDKDLKPGVSGGVDPRYFGGGRVFMAASYRRWRPRVRTAGPWYRRRDFPRSSYGVVDFGA